MPSTATAEPTTTTESTATDTLPRELAYRKNDGIQVALLRQPADSAVTILVEDMRTGVALEFDVAGEDALDAFDHPYAYAP
ncbi:MAG: hypothetical protein ACRDLS_16690 [Solirubrobacteraceae bacterium]